MSTVQNISSALSKYTARLEKLYAWGLQRREIDKRIDRPSTRLQALTENFVSCPEDQQRVEKLHFDSDPEARRWFEIRRAETAEAKWRTEVAPLLEEMKIEKAALLERASATAAEREAELSREFGVEVPSFLQSFLKGEANRVRESRPAHYNGASDFSDALCHAADWRPESGVKVSVFAGASLKRLVELVFPSRLDERSHNNL